VLAIDAEAEAIQRLLRRGDLDSAAQPASKHKSRDSKTRNGPRPTSSTRATRSPSVRTSSGQFGGGSSPRCGPAVASADNSSATATVGPQNPRCPSRDDAEELLGGLEVEHFDEVEEDGETAVGDPKHWQLFQVVARKRTR
jgi:hypothetical protein